MFYGEYEHKIDRKGRLIIPAKLREIFKEYYAEKFFVTRGLDGCLFVFTEEEWRLQEQKFKTLPFTKAESRRFNRLYFSGACEVTCDRQGRVLIPQYLKEYASIQRDVIIVGLSNRIEIWARDKWKKFYDSSRDTFEETAERLFDT
ncbi:MAG: division/cell wall cluster transcriptional repressor MraZ [Candidatus Omnitrophica bacterium]|nr:division/cell wall cluster transcriptional repressor MraZ [Candidatus Omnitrophota bacterium]